jgi:hypothetical protein
MLNNALKESYLAHQQWLAAIEAIRLLQQLAIDVRIHRGSSTAELLGDSFFQPITVKTSHHIDATLQKLASETLCANSCMLESKWRHILLHWRDKKAIESFNSQTAYLEYIQGFIWQLALKSSEDLRENPDCKKSQMAYFLLQQHSHAIESIAKLRGLSCYICAKPNITNEDVRLVRKACRNALLHWENRQQALIALSPESQIVLFVRKTQSQQTQLLNDLIDQIKPTLKAREHRTNASQMFNQANKLLNQLQLQYNQGLDYLCQCMSEDLQFWLKGKSNDNPEAGLTAQA